jgi:NAD(P)H-hydrate epimerase
LDAPLLHAFEADGLDAVRAFAERADVVIDALLGTGSRGSPRPPMSDLVEIGNAAPRARRVAIDLPTGLDADRGEPAELCFQADATVTLVAAKVGFSTPAARTVLGRVVVADIGVPRQLIPGRKNGCRGVDS